MEGVLLWIGISLAGYIVARGLEGIPRAAHKFERSRLNGRLERAIFARWERGDG